MREREAYHGLTVHPGCWAVLRVDGRAFTTFTAERFAKPFDRAFADLMVETAKAVVTEFGGAYGYVESDEISVVLPREFDVFGRSVEKLVSLSAAVASAAFSLAVGERVAFDSRVWVGADASEVVDYFAWRQRDAYRCAINGYAYWALRDEGLSARAATERLRGMVTAEKNDLLFARGVNFNDAPVWQRHGVGLVWRTVPHTGFNPVSGEHVETTRRRLVVDEDLPRGDAYRLRVAEEIAGGVAEATPPARSS